MQSLQSYPVFEADQVLSRTHLNNLVSYLEQQQRLTRIKLLGRGIGCGLRLYINADRSQNTIGEGFGLTSQGYLIDYCESSFSNYIDYQPPTFPNHLSFLKNCEKNGSEDIPFYNSEDLLKLLPNNHPQSNGNERKPISDLDLSSYVIVLFLEARQKNLKNCDTRDCDDKGSRMDFEVIPLLVPKESYTEEEILPIETFKIKRFNIPTKELKSGESILDEFLYLTTPGELEMFEKTLSRCWEIYAPLLSLEEDNPFDQLYLVGIWNVCRSNWNLKVRVQYFIDFLYDLDTAFHEFLKKIEVVYGSCHLNTMTYPLHLNLGIANESTSLVEKSPYRNYFQRPPHMENQLIKEQEAAFLLQRLGKLANNFSWVNSTEGKISVITPSKLGKSALSKRAIPFYYNWTEVDPFWNFKSIRQPTQHFNLGYGNEYVLDTPDWIKNPLEYDLEKFNFFRIEGHVGHNYRYALKNLIDLKSKYSLPFQIIALNSNTLSEIINNKKISCHVMDLESDYKVLITGMVCQLQQILNFVGNIPSKESIGTNLDNMDLNDIDWDTIFDPDPGLTPTIEDISASLNKARKDILGIKEKDNFSIQKKKILLDRLISTPEGNQKRLIHFKGEPLSLFLVNQWENFSYFQLDPSLLSVFLDQIAELITYLITHDLTDFEWKEYEKLYRKYNLTILKINKRLKFINDSPFRKFFNKENEKLFFKCVNEKLLVLLNEYKDRLNEFHAAINFNEYYRRNPGLEHKAGVTKGGTFILVYNRQIKSKVNLIFDDFKPPYINPVYGQLAKSIRALRLDAENITSPLLEILDKKANFEDEKVSPIPDEMVIADFYLPYLCCSDCPPIAYVVEEKDVLEESPDKISIEVKPREFCEDDRHVYPVHVSPPEGTLIINEQVTENFEFVPGELGVGTHVFIYELDNQSQSFSISVNAKAISTIAIEKIGFSLQNGWEISFGSNPVSPLPVKWKISTPNFETESDNGHITESFPISNPMSTVFLNIVNPSPCPESMFKKNLNFHHERIAICKNTTPVYEHQFSREGKVIVERNQEGVIAMDNQIKFEFENIPMRNNQDLIIPVYQESSTEFNFTSFHFEFLDASFKANFELIPRSSREEPEMMLIRLEPLSNGGESRWQFNEEDTGDQIKYEVKNIERMVSFRHLIKFERLECSDSLKMPINTEELLRELTTRGKHTMIFSE